MKKILKIALILTLLSNCANASFKEHFDLGQHYLSNYQYSSAITEFKNAMRINYLDNSARIGLMNSYISRAAYYGNTEHNYEKAANDYRSALFYMIYYPQNSNTTQYIPQIQANLNACLNYIKFDKSPQNRFDTAKKLRASGEFAAAGYEFNQALGNKNLQKDSFEQIADIMKVLGNNPKAAEYYKKAIAVSPNDVNMRLSYAKILDSLGEEDAAVNEYNYILGKSNDSKEVLYALEKIYKKKLEKDAQNADLTANLGAILQKQGKYDEALLYYQKSEYLNPSNINTRLNVGTLYQQKGDYKTAIKAYDSVLILYPDNINANLYKAQAYEAMNDTKTAQEIYKKVLSLDSANTEAQARLLNILKTNMTTAQFVEYVKKNCTDRNPSEIFYNYALDLHKQGKINEALAMYNESLRADNKNPELYVNIAIAQNQGGMIDDAISTLQLASEKFPSDNQVKEALKSIKNDKINSIMEKAAQAYEKQDYQNAIKLYETINPQTIESLIGIASSYQALGQNNKAIDFYKEAFKLKPTDSEIPYYIGALYAETEDFDSAKAYLNKSIVLNKNNQKAIEFLKSVNEQIAYQTLNKGIELYESEKYDESLPIFNEILNSDKSNSYAYYYRGMIYDAKQKHNEAIADFKKALELNEDFTILNYMIASNYDSLEKYKDASSYYAKYVELQAEEDEYKEYSKARIEELKEYVK